MDKSVTLDGFHAVKHALRFGADITDVVALATSEWRELTASSAPDIATDLEKRVRLVSPVEFMQVSPGLHPTGIAAIARRPAYPGNPAADRQRTAPAVLLEEPRRLGNVGAAIRVAAAVGAASVLTTGSVDPWHPAALRGSAGLHFALPVQHLADLASLAGPLVIMDASGADITATSLPTNAILAFGTEREGISPQLRRRANLAVALPMRPGVSSLNLATSVAATLYYWRLTRPSTARSSGS